MEKKKSDAEFTIRWTENGWLIMDMAEGKQYVCQTTDEEGVFATKNLPDVLDRIMKDRREMYE